MGSIVSGAHSNILFSNMKFLLSLTVVVVLFAAASNAQSCVGLCEQGLINGAPCQCNSACSNFGDCCSDYTDVCLSCVDRCGIGYNQNLECQCNTECPNYGNCCSDYTAVCTGSTTSPPGQGDISNAELADFSERVFALDRSVGTGGQLLMEFDFGGSTNQGSQSDVSPNPLITFFDQANWALPTVSALRDLLDNYNPSVTVVEDNTPTEQAEVEAFLDIILATEVMQETYTFLSERGGYFSSEQEFRDRLFTMWFEMYDRDGTSANVVGSSGFEHVFIGESKSGKVSGFHNMYHFYYEESLGNINYLGQLGTATFEETGLSLVGGLTDVFKWNNQMKDIGSMFLGTSPELDFAIYSTCFIIRKNTDCPMAYNGVPFYITTFDIFTDNIGSAYPDF